MSKGGIAPPELRRHRELLDETDRILGRQPDLARDTVWHVLLRPEEMPLNRLRLAVRQAGFLLLACFLSACDSEMRHQSYLVVAQFYKEISECAPNGFEHLMVDGAFRGASVDEFTERIKTNCSHHGRILDFEGMGRNQWSQLNRPRRDCIRILFEVQYSATGKARESITLCREDRGPLRIVMYDPWW